MDREKEQQRILELEVEVAEKEESIRTLQKELETKDEVIRSLIVFHHFFSIRYWFLHLVRSFWMKVISKELQRALDVIYNYFRPTLYQYPPASLKISKRYWEVTLPPEEQLPLVSIVTPSYNQSEFIEDTVHSVISQTYPKVEYIIQDGGSTDGTLEVLTKYRARLTYVESCRDGGQANALNRGFHRSTGEIMAWLNADDLLLPGAIAYVVKYFVTHPNVDVVYGHRVIINERGQEVGRQILPKHNNEVLNWTDLIPQETLFWRRWIWEKTGGYIDESYQYAMDWELLFRFLKAKANFVRLPRFLGAFRLHATQKTFSWQEIGTKEKERLLREYHGRPVKLNEVRRRIKYYILGSTIRYMLYRLRLLRH